MFYLYIILEKSKTVRTECLSVVARSVREGVDCKGLGRMCVHDGLFMSSQTWWLHHYRHLSQPAEQYTKKGGFYCYLRYTLIRIVSGGGESGMDVVISGIQIHNVYGKWKVYEGAVEG